VIYYERTSQCCSWFFLWGKPAIRRLTRRRSSWLRWWFHECSTIEICSTCLHTSKDLNIHGFNNFKFLLHVLNMLKHLIFANVESTFFICIFALITFWWLPGLRYPWVEEQPNRSTCRPEILQVKNNYKEHN
jgi:hypothetical protein